MASSGKEETNFYFILNKGGDVGGKVTHAVLGNDVVTEPAGWDAYTSLALAKEKLSNEAIQKRAKELGIELEIVPLKK